MAQRHWPKLQERIEQCGLPTLTVNSVSDADVFRKQLTCARENDLAVEHGETVKGQSCLAVGIYAREYRVIAVLSICTPTETAAGVGGAVILSPASPRRAMTINRS
jgi:DNA-binding IclR family transcriptional regulator